MNIPKPNKILFINSVLKIHTCVQTHPQTDGAHTDAQTGDSISAEYIFFIESLKTPTSKALMSRQCWKEIDI